MQGCFVNYKTLWKQRFYYHLKNMVYSLLQWRNFPFTFQAILMSTVKLHLKTYKLKSSHPHKDLFFNSSLPLHLPQCFVIMYYFTESEASLNIFYLILKIILYVNANSTISILLISQPSSRVYPYLQDQKASLNLNFKECGICLAQAVIMYFFLKK